MITWQRVVYEEESARCANALSLQLIQSSQGMDAVCPDIWARERGIQRTYLGRYNSPQYTLHNTGGI